jgi:hypothetical protein
VALRPPAWEWSFETDGSLALDRHEVPEEVASGSRIRLSRTGEVEAVLKACPPFGSVPPMPSPRAFGRGPRAKDQQARAARRAGRIAGLVVLAAVLLVMLLLTAFGSGQPASVPVAQPAPAGRLVPAGRPRPQIVAVQGALRIQLPVPQERLTAIGYHAAGSGALPLEPIGRQANEGLFSRAVHRLFGGGGGGIRYYELGGGPGRSNTSLDVGAPPGTDVYAPVDGTVVGLTDYVISGRLYGVRVDLQPARAPSVVVSLTHIRPDPGLTVGASVAAGTSKLGSVLDVSKAERLALARYTQDAGNHVAIEVHPAATLAVP